MATEACSYSVLDVTLSRLCIFQEMLWVQRHMFLLCAGCKLIKTLCFSVNVIGTEACPYSVLGVNLSRLCVFQEMLWVQRHVPTVSWK